MNWVYNGVPMVEIPQGMKAFVYLLTIQYEGQEFLYIGMKNFHSTRRKKVVGKTRREVTVSESNWKSYNSSSETVKSLLNTGGKIVGREVLHLCRTQGMAAYLEAYEQFHRWVLCDPQYLNKWIKIVAARCYTQQDTD